MTPIRGRPVTKCHPPRKSWSKPSRIGRTWSYNQPVTQTQTELRKCQCHRAKQPRHHHYGTMRKVRNRRFSRAVVPELSTRGRSPLRQGRDLRKATALRKARLPLCFQTQGYGGSTLTKRSIDGHYWHRLSVDASVIRTETPPPPFFSWQGVWGPAPGKMGARPGACP